MSKNPHYDVTLTKEAIELLQGEYISDFLIDGKYFNCIAIEPNNAFFNFKINHKHKVLGEIVTEFSIPHSFVLYIVSAEDKRTPGL